MKLLATTTRYYLLLAALLFAAGTAALYAGLVWALRTEMEEKLVTERGYLTPILQRTGRLPLPLGDQRTLSRHPRPAGFSDTLEYDPVGRRWEPFRQLHFPVQVKGVTYWVTLRKSLLENDSPLGVVLSVLAAVLIGLLLSLAALNRWLSGRLWQPFHQTLAALRGYELQRQPATLRLPATGIDEFTELNQALTQLSERLGAEYQSLKEFTENAAHETQTPLAILQAKLERLLQLGARNAEMAPLLRDAYGATLRLSRLHQGLTLLSKIENGQFPDAVPLRLAEVVAEKLGLLEELVSGKELTLTYEAADPVPVRMHPALADSLVVNLLQNAIKHNHPGGTLTVRLGPHALEVRNTGPTLSGDPSRYFERFQKQLPGSPSPGLGLSIVQQVCRHYGFGLRYTYEPATGLHVLHVSTYGLD
ncbi:HAMP domain-containing histidine kinase (plasmid) [Hymenobacter sp. BRD128]|uniref:sensor histidine kinase n=1 Tax=Hymenobacter sp. BRD128 TaxID=2675878 RepID=UPI001566FE5F|nr:HAMP domain-containing sensor histidine kinase [Hymenobacter sp. BRD128]QKG59196.1 HAMP domain-containing histidine kinase [Hymenobacter sp. BRD128]